MKRNKLVSIAAITVALGVLATGCAGGSGSSNCRCITGYNSNGYAAEL